MCICEFTRGDALHEDAHAHVSDAATGQYKWWSRHQYQRGGMGVQWDSHTMLMHAGDGEMARSGAVKPSRAHLMSGDLLSGHEDLSIGELTGESKYYHRQAGPQPRSSASRQAKPANTPRMTLCNTLDALYCTVL